MYKDKKMKLSYCNLLLNSSFRHLKDMNPQVGIFFYNVVRFINLNFFIRLLLMKTPLASNNKYKTGILIASIVKKRFLYSALFKQSK